MLNEYKIKKIIKKILSEMPLKNYTANPLITNDILDKYGIDPISSKSSFSFNKRSPEELMNLTHNNRYDYGKKLESTFINLDINVDVLVQPVDNAAVNFFDKLYSKFGKGDPRSDRLLIIKPRQYFSFIQRNVDFIKIFNFLDSQIKNWIELHTENDCLFVLIGDSIKNQKNSLGKVQWFTKTPWVLTHTLFHQESMLNDDFPEYRDAYIEYYLLCEKLFPNLKRRLLYPYLTFTTGNKRSQLDAKITETDLPNELLVSFLRVVKYLGITDERNDLEIAIKFFIDETPQEIIDKAKILVPYMKKVIDSMFDAWRGNIVFSVTENPDLVLDDDD
jgi:hypothetical protein